MSSSSSSVPTRERFAARRMASRPGGRACARLLEPIVLVGAFGIVVLAAGPAPASGQWTSELPGSGPIRDAGPVPLARIGSDCITLAPDLAPDPAACSVEEAVDLGATGGFRWRAARYARTVASADGAPPRILDELVLLAGPSGGSTTTPTWRLVSDREYHRSQSARSRERPEGLLIEILLCLNGTGGCATEYLLARGSSVETLASTFVDQLSSRLRPGLRLHKGMGLDLATLWGHWPVAGPEDANCCPSWALEFEARIDSGALVLVDAELHQRSEERARDPLVSTLGLAWGEECARWSEPGAPCEPFRGDGSSLVNVEIWCQRLADPRGGGVAYFHLLDPGAAPL